ncbi:MAG: outer membrane protein assembly factor BamD [Chitinophagaceae bacterium]|nr:outer membrane protein assembly factor BamD [Chitinophagaceae bacterium]
MKRPPVFLVSLVFLLACNSKFTKILKSTDSDYKLKMADQYYDAKNYNKAQQLFVELFPVFKGSDKFEDLYYKYAYCSYYLKNYLDAENLFNGYLGVFPNSSRAEEIAYMHALTFYKQSPKVELDQTNTLKAIGMMQTFINNYPNSSRVKEAQTIIDEARRKLEDKDYRSAKLYYDIGQYQAAGIYFTNLLNNYPDSHSGDEYMFMVIKSYYEFAKLSIPDKQEERYQKVVSEYFDFVDRFPESKLLKEAEDFKNISENHIKQLKNEQITSSTNS